MSAARLEIDYGTTRAILRGMRNAFVVATAACLGAAYACSTFGAGDPSSDAGDSQAPPADQGVPSDSGPPPAFDAGCELVKDDFARGLDPRWREVRSVDAAPGRFTNGVAELAAEGYGMYSVLNAPNLSLSDGAAYDPSYLESSFEARLDTSGTEPNVTIMQVVGLFSHGNLAVVATTSGSARRLTLQYTGRAGVVVSAPGVEVGLSDTLFVKVVLTREVGTNKMHSRMDVGASGASTSLSGLPLAAPGEFEVGVNFFQIGPFTNFGNLKANVVYDNVDMRRCKGP